MFFRLLTLTALAVGIATIARPVRADTLLRLSETATVDAKPDEIVASLRADSTAPNAADAQAHVNAAIAEALALAKQSAGIVSSTGRYNVYKSGPTPQDHVERWQASQSLELRGQDGAAMLKLVGALQQKGLAVGQLDWRLRTETQRAAMREATANALKALRGRADEAAALLGLRFVEFKEVRIDSVRPQPIMARGMVAMAASAAMPPPSAESDLVSVSATAEADIVLAAVK